MLYNRNKLLAGGIRPHYYCLPILKHEKDQKALQIAATSGNPKFFAGTDSAPHAINAKENACGCAGIYSAPYAVALYTQIFDELNQLKNLMIFLVDLVQSFTNSLLINSNWNSLNHLKLSPTQCHLDQLMLCLLLLETL